MKIRLSAIVLMAFLSAVLVFVSAVGAEESAIPSGPPEEVVKMQLIFSAVVDRGIMADADYLDQISRDALCRLSSLDEGARRSQYFLYADRNLAKQLAFVGFFNATDRSVTIIGVDKISSGNEKRKGFFVTPTGVFKNSPDFIGYRALGTKNSQGWRGLGAKGSRVWDFGWQKTRKNGEDREIRLLVHATDPDFGEKRLGQVDSKGCIRISSKLNWFLDHYGLLDREYEVRKEDKRFAWVLKADRQPVTSAGQYLLVGDSTSLLASKNLF